MKMARNSGQSQRFKFVLLVIGCFLVTMAYIMISRPFSDFGDVGKIKETANSQSYITSTETESSKINVEVVKPEPEKYSQKTDDEVKEKPSTETIPESKPEIIEDTRPEVVERFEDDRRDRFTLPTVSNYSINDSDPVQQEKSPQKTDSNPAPWNPERKKLCDTSDFRVDVCEMDGEIRIPGNSSTVIFYEEGNSEESYTLHSCPRKGDNGCFTRVRELTVKSSNAAPKCTVTHNVPAVVFSIGGYAGNQFHDFTDLLIPIFLTTGPFNGEVKLIITDYNPYWIYKYLAFFKKISKYPVIEYEKDHEVHCFKHVIVGLKAHKELSIDPERAPKGFSMLDFTKFLRNAYSLPRETMTNIEDLHGRRPKLLLINRKKSRTITNIYEVNQMANDLGFEVIINDAEIGSDMAKYAELVNSCDVLMGVHGAGLTNLVFLPPNATFIQIVPWGDLEGIARYDFGNPAADMNLNYLEYSIGIDESSLLEKYPRDHPVFTDPQQYHHKDFHTLRSTFLDNQNVKLDVTKFRSVLWKALEHVIQ